MLIYNVTINIDEAVADEWVNWMKTEHMPDVVATGCFQEFRLCRIFGEEQGGRAYAAQYLCENMASFDQYQLEHAPRLQAQTKERYGDKFAAFRTLMEIV
ncbi:MAG: DUF4286 family protein [Saprospiraceae bacterium]